jgi:CHAD domain-containing protein
LESAGYSPGPAAETRRDLLFLDTVEGRLARAGWRLALDVAGGAGEVWTVDPTGAESGPGEAGGSDPGAAVFDARALTREPEILTRTAKKPLLTVLRLRIQRRDLLLESTAGPAARLVLDRFSPPGPKARPKIHLSVRIPPGADPAAGGHIRVLLRDRAGLSEAPGDLLTTALRLAGRPEPGALSPLARPVRPEDPVGAAARKIVALQAHRLSLQAPWALRDLHPEFVHDARVATRRLRTVLRLLGPSLGPRRAESLRLELAWAGRLLGAVRDLDVFLEDLRVMERRLPEGMALPTPLLDRLARERSEAMEAMAAGLSGRRFASLLNRLAHLAATPVPKGPRGAPPAAAEAAPLLLRRAEKRARKAGRVLRPGSPAGECHRLRILFKRLRYTGEFFEEALGEEMEGYLKAVVNLQDTLGAHQDSVVGAHRLTAAAEDLAGEGAVTPGGLLTVGALLQQYAAAAAERRAEFASKFEAFEKAARKLRGRARGGTGETFPRTPA